MTKKPKKKDSDREYDFALIVGGIDELTPQVEDALFEAGCDDATLSIQYGRLYIEFSRQAKSFKDAVLGAVRDVRKADIGAEILRVDESDLVTPAEIARRIKRSRQLVFQYIHAQRGPGGFPSPECHFAEGAPLWSWRDVSAWLAENDMIRPEESWNAEVAAAINNRLEAKRQEQHSPTLLKDIEKGLQV